MYVYVWGASVDGELWSPCVNSTYAWGHRQGGETELELTGGAVCCDPDFAAIVLLIIETFS